MLLSLNPALWSSLQKERLLSSSRGSLNNEMRIALLHLLGLLPVFAEGLGFVQPQSLLALNTFFKTNPILGTVLVATGRGLAGDAIAQNLERQLQDLEKDKTTTEKLDKVHSGSSATSARRIAGGFQHIVAPMKLDVRRLVTFALWMNFVALTLDRVLYTIIAPKW